VKLLDRAVELLVGALLVALVVTAFAQVVARYLFNRPFTWVLELDIFLMVWATFLAGYAGVRRDAHLRVDYFLARLTPPRRRLAALAGRLLSIAFVLVLGVRSFDVIRAMEGIGFTSIPLGITTAIAVATHEIPQEVGDVAILLRAGYSRGRAFTLNLLSGIGGILGAVAMLVASKSVPGLLPYVLAFAAGNFLYIAMADLIPDLHRGGIEGGPVRQLLLISAGILTIVAL